MPRAIQTVSGFFTAGAAGTNVATPTPGDTFNVPSFDINNKGRLLQVYASGATTDFVRVRSPRMHDANQGLRLRVGSTTAAELVPWWVSEVIYPSDTPIVEIDATGAGTGAVLVHYEFDDLPGAAPRLANLSDIQSRVIHLMGCEVDVTSGAIGSYGAGVAINANFDNFEAGADYAWLGYTMTTGTHAIALVGKDTGNLKIGGPGNVDPRWTSDYFVYMSEQTGRACIPIIAANNKSSTLLQNVDITLNLATKVTLILAQLA